MNQPSIANRTTHANNERVSAQRTVAPRVDILENPDEFLIVVDMPGIQKEQLRIDLDKGQLVLHAERTAKVGGGNVVSAEFGATAFHRVFAMPRGVDHERVSAELKQGVVMLRLPKTPALKPRRIEVRSS